MPISEITRIARLVTVANIGLFSGALTTTAATLLAIRSTNALQNLKESQYAQERVEYAQNRLQDHGKIGEANLRAGLADLKTQTLAVKLRQALFRQKRMETANRELSSSLQQERQQRLSLEAKLPPRHLSDDQVQMMVNRLLPFRGSGIAFTRIQDQEAWKFGEDIFRPFYLAGWHLTDNEVGVFAPPQYGILLYVPEHLRSDPAALALATALHQAGIEFSIQVGGNDELRLIVGLKPIES